MVPQSDNRPVALGRIVRGHIVLILVTTLAGLLLGALASTKLSKSESATTTILLNTLDGNPFSSSNTGQQLINLETEAQALQSDGVAKMVVAATHSKSAPTDLLGNLSVTNPPNTQILEIAYSAPNAKDATTISQSFADSYLKYRRQRADNQLDGQIGQFDKQIADIQAQLNSLATSIAALPPSSAQAEVLRQQSQTLANQLGSLAAQRSDLVSVPRDPGQVVTPAALDKHGPVNMKLLLIIAGGVIGAAAGLAIATARTVSDQKIHNVGDLDVLDIPVLGVFGAMDPTASTAVNRSAGPAENAARTAEEQIRRIRAALLARQRRPQTAILVSGASSPDHAPLVVAELAGSLARSGLETLVLHATLRTDQPNPLVPDPHWMGLGQLLLGRCSIADATVRVGPMLSAIPFGDVSEDVSDLFFGESMRRLVHALKDRCHVLLISADPIRDGSAQSLTGVVDGVVLEVYQHRTTRNEVGEAVRTVGMLTAEFDGAILVGPEAESWAEHFQPQRPMQRELGAHGRRSLPPAGGSSATSETFDPPVEADAEPSDGERAAPSEPSPSDEPMPEDRSNDVPLEASPGSATQPSHDG